MARGIDNIDFDVIVHDSCVFGEDRNAALTLQITGVHDAFGYGFVAAENAALSQKLVHKGGLAVVNVCNNGYVAQIFSFSHLYQSLSLIVLNFKLLQKIQNRPRRFACAGYGKKRIKNSVCSLTEILYHFSRVL